MNILSPITNSGNITIEKRIPVTWLISEYQKALNIDVSKYFTNLDEILVCRCLDSGYRFFYPYTIAGDGDFYSELEKFSWYYMDDKWEHNETLKYMQMGSRVLEIGCGRGSFLVKARESAGAEQCVGLELNISAVEDAHLKGLDVSSESIEVHARSHSNYYDMVCAFQVLEHISSVGEFISASLAVLRPGGLLVYCVPNNESLIFQENIIFTNMPPHHMGMWSMNAFAKLQAIFDIELQAIQIEPLQEYHLYYGVEFIKRSIFPRDILSAQLRNKGKSLVKDIKGFLKKTILRHYLEKEAFQTINDSVRIISPYLLGHSILVVFRKR
jgi:2-polyprenyl-3-methyl-5-hydroxy-6-metoxy-1,4-benzoquinol methylase